MATLQKIRGKAGLLVGVIGVALLAFIVGDLLNSGHTFFNMNRNKIAVVNGKKITPEEFQAQVQTRTEEMQNMYRRQYGMSLPEGAASRINKEVYDQMVQDILLTDATAELGLTVSKEELADLLQGDNIVPMVKQQFTDPQTGVFNKDLLLNFLQVVLNEDESNLNGEMAQQLKARREAWLNIEKTVKQQQLVGKYFTLLSKSMAPNKLDLEAAYNGAKNSVDFAYAEQSYTSIPDSTVVISESELKNLYNKQKENFKQDEKREVKFFAVDIVPSEGDYKMTEEKINNLKENFSTTDDIAGMLSFNTDVPYVDAYVAQRDMDPEMKKFAETAQINEVYGPVFEDESYKMYRLIGKSVAPDSVKVRHIMFPLQADAKVKAQMDSILTVLKNGGDFAALAKQFSVDQNSAANGGDLGWLTETSAVQFGQKFVSSVFNGGSGYFTVETPYGQHIMQVTERTASVPKVDKIVGPGNIYVALAKKAVYGYVSIDSIAGPSEILVIADETANPRYVAADLLSQAEHDELASAILVTTSEKLAGEVQKEIEGFTQVLSRKAIIEKSLENYGHILIASSIDEAVEIANAIASEHLEIVTANPFEVMTKIRNAGAIFIGENSSEPLGDYFAGPNHILPTNGTAKFFSPLSVDDFVKKSSIIYYSREALAAKKDDIIQFAKAESLTAHANSIAVRFEDK